MRLKAKDVAILLIEKGANLSAADNVQYSIERTLSCPPRGLDSLTLYFV